MQGAAVNLQVSQNLGMTALHLACLSGNEGVATLLVDSGAHGGLPDDLGRLPATLLKGPQFASLRQRLDAAPRLPSSRTGVPAHHDGDVGGGAAGGDGGAAGGDGAASGSGGDEGEGDDDADEERRRAVAQRAQLRAFASRDIGPSPDAIAAEMRVRRVGVDVVAAAVVHASPLAASSEVGGGVVWGCVGLCGVVCCRVLSCAVGVV
jgi:hypothetical protein